ncbi:MAG TPA: hypothetical protein VF456_26285 [Vicinamibacterales bacterium]
MWLNDTATPLERLRDWADKATLTDAEAREYEKRYQLDRTVALTRDTPEFELDVAGDLDTYVPGRLLPGNRTSLITDPADGRVPALTAEAQRRLTTQAERQNGHYAEGPENFTFAERCLIVANTSIPPMMPAFYNNTVQVVQTRDYVMIVSEMIHDVRIIPLNRRSHLPSTIGQWKGDSIGRWDGETLVVDTTNFSGKTTLRGSGAGLHVVERFTLSNANTLKYQFTIEDPSSFARPWSGESQMTRTNDRMFEYACHEANQSLTNTLRGARFSEKEKGIEKTP